MIIPSLQYLNHILLLIPSTETSLTTNILIRIEGNIITECDAMNPLLLSGFGRSIGVNKAHLMIKQKDNTIEFEPHMIPCDPIIIDGHYSTMLFWYCYVEIVYCTVGYLHMVRVQ